MNKSVVRTVTVVPLLLVLAFIFLSEISLAPDFARCPLYALAAGIFLLAGWRPDASAVAFGFLLVTVPFFGSFGLAAITTFWLLALELRRVIRRRELESLSFVNKHFLLETGLLLINVSFLLSALRTVLWELDGLLLSDLLQSGGVTGLLDYVIQNPRSWSFLPLRLGGYLLTAPVAFELATNRTRGRGVLTGLAAGALVCAAFVPLQAAGLHPALSFNRGEFWVLTKRYPGLASDPNAFGVMAALLIPLLFLTRRGLASGEGRARLHLAGAGALLLAAPWSGSRTFWLGMFVFGCGIAVSRLGRERRRTAFSLFAGALLIVGLAGYPPVNEKLRSVLPLPGVNRVLETIDWSESPKMLSSRFLFSRIALEVFREAPLLGVGFGRFYEKQAGAAATLGIELGEWRDNANNLALQLLAEGGLVCFLLFVLGVVQCVQALSGRAATEDNVLFACRVTALSFLILSLTGPHLAFDEVKVLLAVVLGLGVSAVADVEVPVRRERRIIATLAGVSAVLGSVFFVHTGERAPVRGIYAKEYGPEGFSAWTGSRGYLAVCPPEGNEWTLQFRTLHPDLSAGPLEVSFVFQDDDGKSDLRTMSIDTTDWTTVRFALPGGGGADRKWWLHVRVSRLWRPIDFGGGDYRPLGVLLRWPQEACPS